MKKFHILLALSLFNLLFSQDFSVASIPKPLLEHANAVIRQEKSVYTISDVDKLKMEESHVITIMNKAGENHSEIALFYNPSNKVSDIEVKLLDVNGKPMKSYSKKDFTDLSYVPSGTMYSDDRVLLLRPIAPSYPYTLQYSYTTTSSDTGFIPSFVPFRGNDISLEKSSLKVLNETPIKLRTKVSDKEYAKVAKTENGNELNFSFSDIPAIGDENYAPSENYLLPKVEFALDKFSFKGKQSNLQSWTDLGRWYYSDILTPVSNITPEIKAAVASLNLSGTTSEKVKRLYQYMQDNTRYVFVKIGAGGWQPMFAEDVNKKGYGDCKALSNYMRTLLAAAGIKSYCSLINSDDSVLKYDENFPKLSGNHMILMVPTEKETIWLENTSQKIAFNHLGSSTTDRNVVAIKENGAEIVETPSYPATANREVLKAKIKINEDNSIQGDANSVFTGGQYDRMLRIASFKDEEKNEFVKGVHPFLKFEKFSLDAINNNRDDAQLSYDLVFKANDFSKKLGNDIFFKIMPFYTVVTVASDENRRLPFETPYAWQDDFTMEFTFPAGYKTSEIPKDIHIDSEFGTYALEFKNEADKLIVHRVMTMQKGIYPKEKFQNYAAFRKKAANFDNTKILITK